MTINFWMTDPTILFNKEYILELWPMPNMCYEQKLNAISRIVILITGLGYILTMSQRIMITGMVTLVCIYALFKMHKPKITKEMLSEGFNNAGKRTQYGNEYKPDNETNNSYTNPITLDKVLKTEFKQGTKKNPFSNVLLTQIEGEPNRKPAPPAFNTEVDEDISTNVKKTVQMLNEGIKNTNKQLFGNLWSEFQLDQSNRAFYSTPNTKISNDQGAYAKFLYGNMPSAKESTPEGNMQRYADAHRHTLR